ncbi:MAG: hypothetical protein WCJ22_02680, partial [Actinomycetes bacterium]
MAGAGLGGKDVAAFVKKCQNVQNTFPDAKKEAANKAGMAVKTAWLGIAQTQAGITPANKIARRKWNVGYDVQGGMNATTLVEFRGPVHFVFGNTKQHIIGAKLLGTRNSIKNKSGRIGATAAFGGSNRGAFGKMQKKVNYNQYGSVRQQAAKGKMRTRAGKQALTIGGNLRAYAFHPGTGGKTGAWPAAKAAAIRIGPETYSAEY